MDPYALPPEEGTLEAVIADPAGARRDAATTEGAVSEAQQQADRARRELAAARRS